MAVKQFRQFEIILYPDSELYNCLSLIDTIYNSCDQCAYILHDKDVYLDDISDNDGVLIHSKGEIKKPHYHVIFSPNGTSSKSSGVTLASLSKKFNIPENMIEIVKSWRGAVRYLIHFDHADKYQYDLENVISNFDLQSFFKSEAQECDNFLAICDYIYQYHICDFSALTNFIYAHKNLYPAFRRNQNWFSNMIRENKNMSHSFYRSESEVE